MALFKISKGNSNNLPSKDDSWGNGFAWFTQDDGKFYIDYYDGDDSSGSLNNDLKIRQPLNAYKADKLSIIKTVSGSAGWYKIFEYNVQKSKTVSCTVFVSETYARSNGMFKLYFSYNSSNVAQDSDCRWLIRNRYSVDSLRYSISDDGDNHTVSVYLKKSSSVSGNLCIQVLNEFDRRSEIDLSSFWMGTAVEEPTTYISATDSQKDVVAESDSDYFKYQYNSKEAGTDSSQCDYTTGDWREIATLNPFYYSGGTGYWISLSVYSTTAGGSLGFFGHLYCYVYRGSAKPNIKLYWETYNTIVNKEDFRVAYSIDSTTNQISASIWMKIAVRYRGYAYREEGEGSFGNRVSNGTYWHLSNSQGSLDNSTRTSFPNYPEGVDESTGYINSDFVGITDNTTATEISSSDANLITARTLYNAGYTKNTGTVTSVTLVAGDGISLDVDNTAITTSGTRTIGHSNSITAGTAGTSSNTSGMTLDVPYVTYDAQGHITGKGTHTHTVPALPIAGGTMTGSLTLAGDPSSNLQAATKQYVDSAISSGFAANDAMVFKGVLNSPSNIPDGSTDAKKYSAGWTYRIGTAGTYAGEVCEVGDLLIAINDYSPNTSNYLLDWTVVQTNIDYAKVQTNELYFYNTADVTNNANVYIKTDIEIQDSTTFNCLMGTIRLGSYTSSVKNKSYIIPFSIVYGRDNDVLTGTYGDIYKTGIGGMSVLLVQESDQKKYIWLSLARKSAYTTYNIYCNLFNVPGTNRAVSASLTDPASNNANTVQKNNALSIIETGISLTSTPSTTDGANGIWIHDQNGVKYAALYAPTQGVASVNGENGVTGRTTLSLGNTIASGDSGDGNAQGRIAIYGTGTKYTFIETKAFSYNSTMYLPDYSGNGTFAHIGEDGSAVGSTTQPVYVAANGRITAITGTINNPAGTLGNKMLYMRVGWHKLMTISMPTRNRSKVLTILFTHTYNANGSSNNYYQGIIKVYINRLSSENGASKGCISWLTRTGYAADNIKYKVDASNHFMDIYFYQPATTGEGTAFQFFNKVDRQGNQLTEQDYTWNETVLSGTSSNPVYPIEESSLPSGLVIPYEEDATAAKKLSTGRSLTTKLDSTTAVTFDGSEDQNEIPVTGTLPTANGGTGKTSWDINKITYASAANTLDQLAHASTTSYLLKSGSASAAPSWIQYTDANTASTIVQRDASGNFSAGTITATLSGNADSATQLKVTLATTSKAYLTGVTTEPTSTATAMSQVADTGVYLDTTAGRLAAKSFRITNSGSTTNYITSSTDTNIYFSINSHTPLVITDEVLYPGQNETSIDLGSSSRPWDNFYVNSITDNGLTASQAVSTDANKKLVSTNLTVSDPTASGTGITYIATISQSAVGKITATKSTVRSASTSQTGVVQLNDAVNSNSTTTAATANAVKKVQDDLNNHKYWANVEATSAATYNKEPEVATIKLNGDTSAAAASTKNVQLVYDTTLEVLNFVFT